MIIKSDIVDLDTPTGVMRTHVHRPASEGRFPAILSFPTSI
jgi:carboxymethylenebutenolidase